MKDKLGTLMVSSAYGLWSRDPKNKEAASHTHTWYGLNPSYYAYIYGKDNNIPIVPNGFHSMKDGEKAWAEIWRYDNLCLFTDKNILRDSPSIAIEEELQYAQAAYDELYRQNKAMRKALQEITHKIRESEDILESIGDITWEE